VIFNKISKFFKKKLDKKTIGIWGLSFKPKTDDIRESSSIYLIEKLLKAGAIIKAYDPAAMKEAQKQLGRRISYASDPYEALEGADAMVLMTEWSEFHLPDFRKMAGVMKGRVIFDGRNIYDPEEIKKMGFKYFGIGRR
jgi:UDPglucose 6-dehydrogenase